MNALRRLLLLCSFIPACLAQTLILEHATVIDATGAPPKKDFTVVITDGRITSVTQQAVAVAEAVRIDATGKFLIPGLWDMHVHVSVPQISFPLFVANGITGVREMYSGVPLATIRQWKMAPDAPRLFAPGFVDGPLMLPGGANWPDAKAVSTAEQARMAVRGLASQGADFLKVYNSVPRDAFFALADEARSVGIPFAGHVPEAVSPLEASEAGMRSEEHLNNILLNASTQEKELLAARVATMNDPKLSGSQRLQLLAWPLLAGLVDTYDEQKAAALFRAFTKNGTWQTPTLSILAGFARERDDDFANDPRRRYLPKSWTENWDPRVVYYLRDLSPAEYEVLHQRMRMLLTRYRKLVGDMHRAGVELLAGTDTNPFNPVLPGWGLHEELALLVECGLTPMEALQTATRNPARYFGKLSEWGTIEESKAADLVLLDADPLKDIHNTQRINAVVMRGQFYSRQTLDGMLERTAALASRQ
jgi:imidazolonepropionase-like amidohydrolase